MKMKAPKWLSRVILRLTHRMWNRRISSILCRAYEKRIINSHQLHELASCFDPTQKSSAVIYKV